MATKCFDCAVIIMFHINEPMFKIYILFYIKIICLDLYVRNYTPELSINIRVFPVISIILVATESAINLHFSIFYFGYVSFKEHFYMFH